MKIRLRISIIILLALSLSTYSYAGEIKGHVYDRATREQVVGAVVVIKSLQNASVTELDGAFYLKDLEPGQYTVNCSYLGYATIDSVFTIKDKSQTITIDLYLSSLTRDIKEVEIKGKGYGGSDEFANRREKTADNIMNIVSANSIQISPDIAVSEVMQRVSGVSVEKGTSGEGQYAIIRGMDKRYNTTLINGIKIPSPDNRDRFVPMDMFPAELLERLEVIKSLTPSMEGDATGGVINMVMKNAPYKFIAEGNLAFGYGLIWQNRDFLGYSTKTVSWRSPSEVIGEGVNVSPSYFPYQNLITNKVNTPVNTNASLTLGNRFLNNKLGVIVSGSLQNYYKGYNSNSLKQSPTVQPAADSNSYNKTAYSDINVRQYSILSKRLGVETKIDYELNDNNSFSVFATYLQLNEYRVRTTSDSTFGAYSFNGYIGANALQNQLETRSNLQDIYNVTLQGKHLLFKGLTADWSLAASQAKKQLPDIANFATDQSIGPDKNNPTKLLIGDSTVAKETRSWLRNTDKDYSVYLNFHYVTDLIPGLGAIDFGGLYRNKTRENYYNTYELLPVGDSNSNDERFRSIQASRYYFVTNHALGIDTTNGGTYHFDENILSYYLQVHYKINERINLLGGARIENTSQGYTSYLPVYLGGRTATYSYIDFLPSLQAKYNLSKDGAIRFSYFRSLYRPAFSDLIPFPDNTINPDYDFVGNDTLKHSVIENADVRYEIFPKGLDQFMVGAFYKYIKDPIEYAIVHSGSIGGEAISPINTSNATNFGFELVFRKFFGSFGVSGNYTYTKSVIQSPQVLTYDKAGGGTETKILYLKRPLQGQADHIGNISLLYKNAKNGIDAQLALVYVGERIYVVSQFAGQDNWEKPTVNLDFSVQKQIGKHFTIYFKANNLLNTGFELFIKQANVAYTGDKRLPFQESANYIVLQKDNYYSSFLLGARFKF